MSDDDPDAGAGAGDDGTLRENDGHRFGRLPATEADRQVAGRPTRAAVLDFWTDRYGIPPGTFEGYSFWERGAGKIWVFHGEVPAPAPIEGLGMTFLRTRREHWKPTTEATQRFGRAASRNVLELDRARAERFVAGEDQQVAWDGDWGYLIVAHELAGDPEPIGVGLYIRGELRSQIPKGRRREL
jgi:NOL1/NOP2/fmu family ribosome biogenesis protein